MKRQTILTILVILVVVGMLVVAVDPVAAADDRFFVVYSALIPISIEYPAQNR